MTVKNNVFTEHESRSVITNFMVLTQNKAIELRG